MDKPLKCPNCYIDMEFIRPVRYNGEKYDQWDCPDCSHIIVLDFRGETDD